MKVYSFKFRANLWECGSTTISIHYSKAGAEAALAKHKNKTRREIEKETPGFILRRRAWDYNQAWYVEETKIEP